MFCPEARFIYVRINKTGSGSVGRALKRHFPQQKNRPFNHTKLKGYQNILNLDEYFKFAFVRNPWDKVISQYSTQKEAGNTSLPFEQWLQDPTGIPLNDQYSCIVNREGKPYVNLIGRFETLQRDFNKVCAFLGVPDTQLPHTHKTNHKPYQTYYNEATEKRVAEIYARDIERFGYEFGS